MKLLDSIDMNNLSTYIRNSFVKYSLYEMLEPHEYVESIEHANKLIFEVSYGKTYNLIFKNSHIKEYFIDNLYTVRPDINVINCNCSIDKFYENDFDGLLIFNNVKHCKHKEIIEEIQKHKCLLLC